jgi:hypothetical protein
MHEDVWNTTDFHRAIQKRIGETLSAGYDLSLPLPERMRILLGQLDEPRDGSNDRGRQPGAPNSRQCRANAYVRAATLC